MSTDTDYITNDAYEKTPLSQSFVGSGFANGFAAASLTNTVSIRYAFTCVNGTDVEKSKSRYSFEALIRINISKAAGILFYSSGGSFQKNKTILSSIKDEGE